MGCCLSNTNNHHKSPPSSAPKIKSIIIQHLPTPPETEISKPNLVSETKKQEEENEIKREKSGVQDEDSKPDSATKSKEEEVDAILIQCGRLSRNPNSCGGRRYSGSKRSHDFDHQQSLPDLNLNDADSERRRRRESTGGTNQERDPMKLKSGRRLSMSPGRRRRQIRSNSPICRTPNSVKMVKKRPSNSAPLAHLDLNSLPIRPKSTKIDDEQVSNAPIRVLSQNNHLDAKDASFQSPLIVCTSETLGNKKPVLSLLASEVSDNPSSCNSSNLPTIGAVRGSVVDDLKELSVHKYVTVRKRGYDVEDFDELESSGSNSFVVGSQNRWQSSSSWEPNSADSSDRWQSSSSRSRGDGVLPVSFPRLEASDAAADCGDGEDSRKNVSKIVL